MLGDPPHQVALEVSRLVAFLGVLHQGSVEEEDHQEDHQDSGPHQGSAAQRHLEDRPEDFSHHQAFKHRPDKDEVFPHQDSEEGSEFSIPWVRKSVLQLLLTRADKKKSFRKMERQWDGYK